MVDRATTPRRVTATDVARLAGTSVSTVSLVVNGKAGGRVSPVNAARVREAVEALGYVVDQSASALARGGTDLVALLAPNLTNPYFAAVIGGIRERLGPGRGLLLYAAEDDRQPSAADVDRVLALRPAAVVVFSPADGVATAARRDGTGREPGPRRSWGVPVVLLDAPEWPGPEPVVGHDPGAAIDDLVRHLAGLGHRRIGYLDAATPSRTFARRLALVERSIRAHGIELVGPIERCGVDIEVAAALARAEIPRWRDERVTAVVAAADMIGYGILLAAASSGLAVPRELAVASFDDLPFSRVSGPPLTSIALPGAELGRAGAEVLLGILAPRGVAGEDCPPAPRLLPARLITRASTTG